MLCGIYTTYTKSHHLVYMCHSTFNIHFKRQTQTLRTHRWESRPAGHSSGMPDVFVRRRRWSPAVVQTSNRSLWWTQVERDYTTRKGAPHWTTNSSLPRDLDAAGQSSLENGFRSWGYTCKVIPLLKDTVYYREHPSSKDTNSRQQGHWMNVILPLTKGHLFNNVIRKDVHKGCPYLQGDYCTLMHDAALVYSEIWSFIFYF